MRVWVLLFFLAALAVARRAPTRKPSRPPTRRPSLPLPTPKPSARFSADEYAYFATLYYERAAFIYANFPHSGPAFDRAQLDEARARYYAEKARE